MGPPPELPVTQDREQHRASATNTRKSSRSSTSSSTSPVAGRTSLLTNTTGDNSCCCSGNSHSHSCCQKKSNNPPDIVVSASPRFARKKDFKAVGRARSEQRKLSRKMSDSMEESIHSLSTETTMVVTEEGGEIVNQTTESVQETEEIVEQMGETVEQIGEIDQEIETETIEMTESSEERSEVLSVHMTQVESEQTDQEDIHHRHHLVEGEEQVEEEEQEEVVEAECIRKVQYLCGEEQVENIEFTETSQTTTSMTASTTSSIVHEDVATIENVEFSTVEEIEQIEIDVTRESSVVLETFDTVSSMSSRKPSSLALNEHQQGEGGTASSPGFWTHSARNSVISLASSSLLTSTESSSGRTSVMEVVGGGEMVLEAGQSPTESVREFLIHKRTSLSHTPDIMRVFEKEIIRNEGMHEFQKVKNELRHVDEQRMLEARRLSQQQGNNSLEQQQQEQQQQMIAVAEEEVVEAADSSRKISKEMIVDLVPGPVTLVNSSSGVGGVGGAAVTPTGSKTAATKTTAANGKKQTTGSSAAKKTTPAAKKEPTAGEKSQKKVPSVPTARGRSKAAATNRSGQQEDRAQYLHLSLEQIQELALKQQQGTLCLADLQQQQHQVSNTCAVHHHATAGTTTTKKATAVAANNSETNGRGRKPLSAANKETKSAANNANNKQNSNKTAAKGPAAAVPTAASLQSPALIKNMKGGKKETGDSGKKSAPQAVKQTSDDRTARKAAAANGAALESPGLIKDLTAVSTAETGSSSRADEAATEKKTTAGDQRLPSPTRNASPVRKPSPECKGSPAVMTGGERSGSPQARPKAKSTTSAAISNGPGAKDQRKASTESGSSVSSNKENEAAGGRRTSAPTASTATAAEGGKVREKTLKREDMLFAGSRQAKGNTSSRKAAPSVTKTPFAPATAVATTEATAKGGFLAPTQAWLSHMGEKLDFKSRSPSPSRREGSISATVIRKPLDRSPSPRHRLPGGSTRDSSVESGARRPNSAAASLKSRARNVLERDPSLPKIRRSGSLRAANGKQDAGENEPVATTAAVKRSSSLRKQASDLSGVALKLAHKQPPPANNKPVLSASKGAAARSSLANGGRPAKAGNKTTPSSVESKIQPLLVDGAVSKKDPPPVPPKPDKDRLPGAELGVSDSAHQQQKQQQQQLMHSSKAGIDISSSNLSPSNGGTTGELFVSQARLSTAAETTSTAATVIESGIEETSISASSVIRKFESVAASSSSEQLRGSNGSLATRMTAGGGETVNANLLQDTVSSRLKKVSKEELSINAEESSGETTATEQTSLAEKVEEKSASRKSTTAASEEKKTTTSGSRTTTKKSSSISSKSSTVAAVKAKSSSATAKSANMDESVATGKEVQTKEATAREVVTKEAISTLVNSSSAEASSTTTSAKATSSSTASKSAASSKQSTTTSRSSVTNSSSSAKQSSASSSSSAAVSIKQSTATSSSSSTVSSSKQSTVSSKQSSSSTSKQSVITSSAMNTSASSAQLMTSSSNARSAAASNLAANKHVTTSSLTQMQTSGCANSDHAMLGCDNQYKTTMVVRLHPGQSRRLSACIDKQAGVSESGAGARGEHVSQQTWLAEVEHEATATAVCGLEISFQSIPQAIDIRLINSRGEAIATQEAAVGATAAKQEKSISSETINVEASEANKTRQ